MQYGGLELFGANGGTVEVDETFIGRDFDKKPKGEKRWRDFAHKSKALTLVDRELGKARSIVVDDLQITTRIPPLQAHISPAARAMTDEAGTQHKSVGKHFADHGLTCHGQGKYMSQVDRTIHTNTIEGCFLVFKRGMKGVYTHCGHRHLNCHVAEFDFRITTMPPTGLMTHSIRTFPCLAWWASV